MLQLTVQLRNIVPKPSGDSSEIYRLNCRKCQTSEAKLSTTPFQNHQKFHTLPFPRFPELLTPSTRKTGGRNDFFSAEMDSVGSFFFLKRISTFQGSIFVGENLAHRIHQRIPHLPGHAFLLGMTHRLGEISFDEITGCHPTTVSVRRPPSTQEIFGGYLPGMAKNGQSVVLKVYQISFYSGEIMNFHADVRHV